MNVKIWLLGLINALINGIASGVVLIIAAPETFNLQAGFKKLISTSIVMGIIGAANYVKKSPIPGAPTGGVTLAFLMLMLNFGSEARAQSNTPPAFPPLTTTNAAGQTVVSTNFINSFFGSSASANPSGLVQGAEAVGTFLEDAYPYFGTNATLNYDAAVLYNRGHVGGFLGVTLPLQNLASTGQIGIGSGLAYLNGQFLTLSLNAQAGTTWNLPLIGNVYTAVGSGPDFNFKTQSPGAYSFFEAFKGWDIGAGHVLALFGGVAYETSNPGPIFNGGLSCSL